MKTPPAADKSVYGSCNHLYFTELLQPKHSLWSIPMHNTMQVDSPGSGGLISDWIKIPENRAKSPSLEGVIYLEPFKWKTALKAAEER